MEFFPEAIAHYEQAFDRWQADMRRRGAITNEQGWAVYEDMWRSFARSCTSGGRAVPLADLRLEDLERFIRSRASRQGAEPTPRYVWRLLHLIDRVLTHAAGVENRPAPTAPMELLASRTQWRYANARRSESIDYLNPAQARGLVEHLSQVRPRPGRQAPEPDWQSVRNATALALQLGAGLAPGEVRTLQLSAVEWAGASSLSVPWKLRVAAAPQGPVRETPIAQWAGQLLRYWQQRRAALAIPGPWLLPSTRTGKPWSTESHHACLVKVLRSAGWLPEQLRGGSFRLRHTFALRQLRKGFDEKEVARWLGVEPDAMLRYRGILMDPILDIE